MLLTEHEEEYLQLLNDNLDDGARLSAETERFAANHCHKAADLIDDWQVGPFMGDAIRYHLEPCEAVRGAHHLVKIVTLAGLLSRQHLNPEPGIDEQVLATGVTLFGLTEESIHDLAQRTGLAVQTIISGLGLVSGPEDDNDRQARQDMAEQLNLLTGIRQAIVQFSKAQSCATLQQAIQRSLLLTFDIPKVLLFAYNDNQQSLEVHLSGQENHGAAFTIPSNAEHSVVAECYLEKAPRGIDASENPGIVDQQLIKYCGTRNLLCLPLDHQHESLGVIAFGLGVQQLETFAKHAGLARHLAAEIAHRIVIIKNNSRLIADNQSENTEVELRINEAVHEASNPLTIILNYLEVLRVKLGLGHEEEENLEHVKEEIERVSKILQRLKNPGESGESTGTVQQVIESLTGIFRESLCQSKNISIRLDIDHDTMTTTVDDTILKQILSNLLRNAIEALPPDGEILVSTENDVSVGGKANLAIYIQDNGPGIADEIKPLLFSPMKSTKGIAHSGLGLSIVKKLLDEIGGTIVCRSNSNPEKDVTGTQFQILIPRSP
jgi:signal transduction histidine kinase